MNFNFSDWNQRYWDYLYGGIEKNGQPCLFLGPKGWLYSLSQGINWPSFWGNGITFVLANGTASYSISSVTVQQSTELVFDGAEIPKINLRQQIPPNVYSFLCDAFTRVFVYRRNTFFVKMLETFWVLQILKELIAKGWVNIEADVALTPCESLLDHLEFRPIPASSDREDLFESLIGFNLRGHRGEQDLGLAREINANAWWIPLFSSPQNTSRLVVQCSPKEYRIVPALPFAFVIENKEKERFSLFFVDTIGKTFTCLCQRKNFADLMPFLAKKIPQEMLEMKEPQMGEVNVGRLCCMQMWNMQPRHSNRAEMIWDIEKLQQSLRQWALQEKQCEPPNIDSLIRQYCVTDPVPVQLELNGL